MKMTDELRHLDGIKGNFYISESGYLAPATYQNNVDGRGATFMFTLPAVAEVNNTYK
jgi:hypothetical protein